MPIPGTIKPYHGFINLVGARMPANMKKYARKTATARNLTRLRIP